MTNNEYTSSARLAQRGEVVLVDAYNRPPMPATFWCADIDGGYWATIHCSGRRMHCPDFRAVYDATTGERLVTDPVYLPHVLAAAAAREAVTA